MASDGQLATEDTGGHPALAVATAADPSYAEGRYGRLSLNLAGYLRVISEASAAIIGKVSTDRTTPGTTNSVAPITGQDGVAAGAGAVSALTQRMTLASDDPAVAALGTTSGAAVITDAAGTIQQYLRGLVKRWADALGAGTAAAALRTTLASDDPAVTTLGATSGAKVVTDANGTLQQYLRGLVSQWIAGTLVVGAGSNLIGRTVADASAATGGIATTARLASAAASTNATNVKGSAARIYQASGKNNAAYDVFLVLYDSAANPPVPSSTTIRKKIVCPAGQAFVYDWPLGLSFATGIGYAFTKLVADADTTVLVAADITAFNLDYV